MEERQYKQDAVDKAFKLSLILKGLDGLAEILGGILLLLIRPEQIIHLAHRLTDSTLAHNPHSLWASRTMDWANGVGKGSLLFGAIYLLSHGIVKLFVVVEVWRNRSWAYPLLIGVIGLFVLYQLYYLAFRKVTAGMIGLTIFDLVIIYLTVIEYRRHRARHNFANEAKD
ncbi:MAG TPA: DUF2127 domain-containing protein [Candidatus Saccharimonadales bacterium]|nr:DUF2127 domain-containing protein [Candidatus Saccharimonadales bacterium]